MNRLHRSNRHAGHRKSKGWVALLLGWGLAVSAHAAEFNITADNVAEALNEYARQANVQLVFPYAALEPFEAPRLNGEFEPDAALAQLLTGTGYTFVRLESGDIAIVQAEEKEANQAVGEENTTARPRASQPDTPSREPDGTGQSANGEPAASERQLPEPAAEDVRNLDDVIVHGRSSSMLKSIQRKRNATNIIDTLSADENARFPDNTVAEALRRLPGISFQRETDSGEGEFISIRGLDSALNTVQFDGITGGSASVGSGDAAGDRRVELDGISADNVEEIRVNKSLLPEHNAEGIGGVVNIISVTPLSRGEDDFRFSVEGRHFEFSERTGYGASVGFNKLFGPDFGVRLSAGTRKRFIDSIEVDLNGGIRPLVIPDFGVEMPSEGIDPFINSDGLLTHENSKFTSEQFDITADQQERDNYHVGGAIEWQVTPTTNFLLTGRYARQESDIVEQTLELDTDDDYEVNPDTGLSELVLDDQEITFEGEIEDETETNSYINFAGQTFWGPWTFDYKAGFARIKEEQPIIVSVDFQTELPTQVGIAPLDNSNPRFPMPAITDEALEILNNPGSAEIFDFDQESREQEEETRYSGRLDVSYETYWPFMPSLKAGGYYLDSDRDRLRVDLADSEDSIGNVSGLDLGPDGAFVPGNPGTDFQLGDTGLLNENPFGLGPIGNPFRSAGIEGLPNFNRDALIRFARNAMADSQGIEEINFINAEEEILSGYFQGLFEIGNLSLVAGVRVADYEGNFRAPTTASIEADFSSAGGEDIDLEAPNTNIASNPAVNATSADNTEVLPRFQANYRAGEQWVFRLGYYTSIARPAFDSLAAETDVDVNVEFGSGTPETATLDDVDQVDIAVATGNPGLDNAEASNFDVTAEFYASRGTALTLGLFYKEIDNFLFVNQNADFASSNVTGLDLGEFIDQIELSEEGAALLERLGGGAALADFENLDIDVEIPRNGRTAEVYGLEFGLVHLFDWLPAPFDGFGFLGNLTYQQTEADVELGVLDEDDALVVLGMAEAGETFVREVDFFNSPDLLGNWNIFYEKGPVKASLSWSYQSEGLSLVDEFGIDQFDASFDQLDFTFDYTLPIGRDKAIPMAGEWNLFFRVSDLTDGGRKFSSFQTFGKNRLNSDFASFNGREFRFGIRADF